MPLIPLWTPDVPPRRSAWSSRPTPEWHSVAASLGSRNGDARMAPRKTLSPTVNRARACVNAVRTAARPQQRSRGLAQDGTPTGALEAASGSWRPPPAHPSLGSRRVLGVAALLRAFGGGGAPRLHVADRQPTRQCEVYRDRLRHGAGRDRPPPSFSGRALQPQTSTLFPGRGPRRVRGLTCARCGISARELALSTFKGSLHPRLELRSRRRRRASGRGASFAGSRRVSGGGFACNCRAEAAKC